MWPELCKAMERTDLLEDPRFQTTDSRRAHAAELAAILDPVFAAHPWPEWRKRLRHHEITFGLLGVLRDVPHDHQAVANGAVVDSSLSDMPRTLSAPIRLSFAPEPVTPGPGPGHGEHTDAVLSELGYSPMPRSTRCARRVRWGNPLIFLSPLGERLGEGVNAKAASCITPSPQREGYFARPLPQEGEEPERRAGALGA